MKNSCRKNQSKFHKLENYEWDVDAKPTSISEEEIKDEKTITEEFRNILKYYSLIKLDQKKV